MWHWLADIHRGPPGIIVAFYTIVVAVLLFAWLQVLLVRGRLMALSALEQIKDLAAEVRDLRERLSGMERRLEERLDARFVRLEQGLAARPEQSPAPAQEQAALAQSVKALEARLSRLEEKIAALPKATPDASSRAPALAERIEDIARTVPGAPLRPALGLSDSSQAALRAALDEVKAELQLGLGRVERIESTLRGREKEEDRPVVGVSQEAVASEPLSEQEAEFEEWEQEAKDSAASDDTEALLDDVHMETASEFVEQAGDYPAEMGETAAESTHDDLEEDLLEEDVELPEIDDEEGTEDG